MTLNIHALYHVEFEKLGYIKQWADNHGHIITTTRFYENDALPAIDDFDWLIVMGGPMGVHDEAKYPWLIAEKQFIQRSIDAGKTVLGVCLGAQLIAHCLGSKVAPSGLKEVGWLPIELTQEGRDHPLLQSLPNDPFTVFHWHGDGFECPKGAIPIATSKLWQNQGFIYQNEQHQQQKSWVMGWQCHFEVTPKSMIDMVEFGTDYIEASLKHYPDSVQSPEEIVALGESYMQANHVWLTSILNHLVAL